MSEQAPFLDACPDHGELVFREGKCPICRRAAKNWAWKIETRGEGFVVRAWDHGFRRVYVATRSMAERIANLPNLEQELSSLRQEMFDSLDREGHRIEQLRRDLEAAQSAIREQAGYVAEVLQELEQARVNEGEAMLVLEGTEAKLEEAKRQLEATDEAGMVTVIAKNESIADLQADIDILRQEREEAKRDKAKWHHLAVIRNGEKESRDYWQEQAVNRGMLVDALQAENEKLRAALRETLTVLLYDRTSIPAIQRIERLANDTLGSSVHDS